MALIKTPTNKITAFISSLAIPLVVGTIGSLATLPNITSWYSYLNKPSFNPPNWLFGPVWTFLYLLMGVSLYLLWIQPSKKNKTKAFTLFGLQLTLNLLWSLVFFGLHSIIGGGIIIVALLVAIIVTMRLFWEFSKVASLLLLPYLLWVSFATVLNGAIFALN